MTIYSPQEIKLANELASTLRDWDSFPAYLSYAKKFTEKHLRKRLATVMAMDASNIKKSRGALFTHLINLDILQERRPDNQDFRYIPNYDDDMESDDDTENDGFRD